MYVCVHVCVCMCVSSDIYGGDYNKYGLKASIVASAFGKLTLGEKPWLTTSCNDIAAGLLHMIGANISQIAYLNARLSKVTKIVFAGSFMRHNRISSGFLAYSVDYWSRGKVKALFLKHEGFCGSIGALLQQDV